MNAKVLIAFTDRYTGKKYKPGDVIGNIKAERFNEILTKGNLIEAIDTKTTKEKN